jgi:hypothetical protein
MKKCEGVSGELSLYNNWSWRNVKVFLVYFHFTITDHEEMW